MENEPKNENVDITSISSDSLKKEVDAINQKPNSNEEPLFKKSSGIIPAIRTYKQDYSGFIRDKNIGKVEILSAEMKRGFGQKGDEDAQFGPKKKKNIILPIFILAATCVTGYLVYLILSIGKPDVSQKQPAQIPAPLIFSEKQENIVLNGDVPNEIEEELKAKLLKPYTRNNIIYLPIVKDEGTKETFVDVKEFLSLSKVNPPEGLVQSLEGPYTLGIYSKNERYPILIFKIKLYESAFAGMLEWEKRMPTDLSNIWPIKKVDTSLKFADKFVRNHDIRELDDANGNLVLNYSFLDKTTLVISTNEEALNAVFERFTFKR